MTQQAEPCRQPSVRILRLAQVRHLTGMSRSAIYEMMRSGAFPRSLALGARSVGWVESEVVAWIESRIEARVQSAAGI